MSLLNRVNLSARGRKVVAREQARMRLDGSVAMESVFQGFSESQRYKSDFDIFLSHSYRDKLAIIGLKTILEEDFGHSVYVDWVVDPQLDRKNITRNTINLIKKRMQDCRCLFYATSANTDSSRWMPWETGFMDGITSRVAICPYVDSSSTDSFSGQEYLGVYPYVTQNAISGTSQNVLWIRNDKTTYVRFSKWLKGNNPTKMIHG